MRQHTGGKVELGSPREVPGVHESLILPDNLAARLMSEQVAVLTFCAILDEVTRRAESARRAGGVRRGAGRGGGGGRGRRAAGRLQRGHLCRGGARFGCRGRAVPARGPGIIMRGLRGTRPVTMAGIRVVGTRPEAAPRGAHVQRGGPVPCSGPGQGGRARRRPRRRMTRRSGIVWCPRRSARRTRTPRRWACAPHACVRPMRCGEEVVASLGE